MVNIEAHISRKKLLKWLLVIAVIKAVLFTFFAHQFLHYAKAGLVTSSIVVEQADSRSYYAPAKSFVEGGEYEGICRMPGLLPQYALFAWTMGHQPALVAVVVFQFLCSVFSVLFLAIIASRLIPHRRAFEVTALAYALSSFVSVWDHTLLSDSFATSALIISCFFLTEYCTKRRAIYLLLSGFWLTWAIFTRQIIIIFLPVLPLLWWVWSKESFGSFLRGTFVFASPFALLMTAWTIRNYQLEKTFIPLIKPIASCWTTYTPQFMKINEMLIVYGEDVQYWIVGSPAEWFGSQKKQPQCYPFRSDVNTTICNADSIVELQHLYVDFRISADSLKKQEAGALIMSRTTAMIEAYKREHAFSYYVTNRLRMMRDFVLPPRLDNTPGPAFGEMNIVQKAVKLGYYALLLLVNILGICGAIYALLKRNGAMILWAFMPVLMIIVLAGVMGYIEQRYLVPAYPLLLVSGVFLVLSMHARYFRAHN
jgi:hypothetical protein